MGSALGWAKNTSSDSTHQKDVHFLIRKATQPKVITGSSIIKAIRPPGWDMSCRTMSFSFQLLHIPLFIKTLLMAIKKTKIPLLPLSCKKLCIGTWPDFFELKIFCFAVSVFSRLTVLAVTICVALPEMLCTSRIYKQLRERLYLTVLLIVE